MLLHAAYYWLWLMSTGTCMLSIQGLFGVCPDLRSMMIFVYIFDIRLLVTLLRATMLIGLLENALVALNLLLQVLLEGGHSILDVHLSDDGGRRIVRFHAHRGHWVCSYMVLLVDLRAPTRVLSLGDVLFRHVLILVR